MRKRVDFEGCKLIANVTLSTEDQYAEKKLGCFMFYFTHNSQQMWCVALHRDQLVAINQSFDSPFLTDLQLGCDL